MLLAGVLKVTWNRLTDTRDALYRHVDSCALRNEQEAGSRADILRQLTVISSQLDRVYRVQDSIMKILAENSRTIAVLDAKKADK